MSTPVVNAGSAASCPALPAYTFRPDGKDLTLVLPTGNALRSPVASDGSVTFTFSSAMANAGTGTVTGNARTREMQLSYSGLQCRYVLKPDTASVASLQACEQAITYSVVPPGPTAPAGLRGFSGVWVGSLGPMCYTAIFDRLDDPRAVVMVVANGRWSAANPAIPPATRRIVAQFDGKNKLWVQDSRFTTEWVLRGPAEIAVMSSGTNFTPLNGTLKKQ